MRRIPRVWVRGTGVAPVQRSFDAEVTIGGAMGAIEEALHHAKLRIEEVGAMVVGNMLSARLQNQHQVATLLANRLDFRGGCFTVEAACGSGGAALYQAQTLVRSGQLKNVLVLGYEHMRHPDSGLVTKALAGASHWETEGAQGETFVSLNGRLMEDYLRTHNLRPGVLAPIAMVAHQNAAQNPNALFQSPNTTSEYAQSAPIHPSLRLLDASAICNGSAAMILSAEGSICGSDPYIRGAAAATDFLSLENRPDPLRLKAVELSTADCLEQADLVRSDLDCFEFHDAYTIMAALSMESGGFVPPGMAGLYGSMGEFLPGGALSCASHGGLLRRGHPVGASGVYQAVEACHQLRKSSCSNAFIQSIGGAGTAVYTHILSTRSQHRRTFCKYKNGLGNRSKKECEGLD